MKSLIIILFLIFILYAYSLDFRVNQIPNGNIYDCTYCHYSAGEGGPLNPFGQQVESIGLTNYMVDWSKLYNKDADGDGYTNGQEMGDPNGEWRIGDPDPEGDYTVTKPWDPDDFPTSINTAKLIANFKAFPNPFKEFITLNFEFINDGNLNVEVFDLNGNKVKSLINIQSSKSNQKSIIWDGTDFNGQKVNTGVYFIKFYNQTNSINKKVILD